MQAGSTRRSAPMVLEEDPMPFPKLTPRTFSSIRELNGIAARGWAWLAYDHDWNTLTTVIGDAQNTFPLWNATPIVALDVYEHAYWIDYGRARAKYIDAFFNNLDWNVVEQNLEKALAMQAVHK